MPRAAVRILHPEPAEDAGELTRLVATARSIAAENLAGRFVAAGAGDVRIDAGPSDGLTFGARLRALAEEVPPGDGLVVLGSGSIPLATREHLEGLLATAASGERRAATNNRYSSDVFAIGDATILASVPDLRSDNVVPRWLESAAGARVDELPDRAALGVDIDSPLDLELLRRHPDCPAGLVQLAGGVSPLLAPASRTLDDLAALARDRSAELLVAGRVSAATLRRLETGTACRVRAFVEERGLRTAPAAQRRPSSVLALLLERDGPGEIGGVVGRFADGAVVDSRVLLAHHAGADEEAWPSPEDRYASDLLLADRVRDAWLQELTSGAAAHDLPIALGGHTLVGPGLPLALGLDA